MCMDRRLSAVAGNTEREYWIFNLTVQAWFRIKHNFGKNYLGRMHVVNSRYGISNEQVSPGVYFGHAPITGVYKPHIWRLEFTQPYDTDHLDVQKTFTVDVETNQMDFDEPHKKKRIRYLTVEGSFTELSVTQFDERNVSKVYTRTGVAADADKITVYRVPGLGYFRSLRVKITMNPASGGLRLYGLELLFLSRARNMENSVGLYADTAIR